MIVDERITAYINSLSLEEIPFLEELEQTALKNRVPIIRKGDPEPFENVSADEMSDTDSGNRNCGGFSALLMSEYVDPACKITTIENYEKRIPIARENFQKAGKEEQITLLPGDAMELLKGLSGPYDFMFLDAAKAQYIYYLPELLRMLPEGGILVTDNVLQDGNIVQSRFAVERRDRTIHARMREYLYTITHCEELATSILPLGDGVTVSVKKRKLQERKEEQ